MAARQERLLFFVFAYLWNVLAEERGAQEQRKCSCKVT